MELHILLMPTNIMNARVCEDVSMFVLRSRTPKRHNGITRNYTLSEIYYTQTRIV